MSGIKNLSLVARETECLSPYKLLFEDIGVKRRVHADMSEKFVPKLLFCGFIAMSLGHTDIV